MKGSDIVSDQQSNETMLDMYIFETTQNIEQLEKCILESESSGNFTQQAINEIFRIMHTIKGSSAMMLFTNISILAHTMEDLFYYIRDQKPKTLDFSLLSNLILEGIDFIKVELYKARIGEILDGDAEALIESIKSYLTVIKQNNSFELPINSNNDTVIQNSYYDASNKLIAKSEDNFYKATVFFENGCEMENIRSYAIIYNLKDLTEETYYHPSDILENNDSIQVIREEGFKICIKTNKSYNEINEFFSRTIFLKDLELVQIDKDEFNQFVKPMLNTNEDNLNIVPTQQIQTVLEQQLQVKSEGHVHNKPEIKDNEASAISVNQTIISVNVSKLDKLMDLVGEMVIAEAMVIQNPDLNGLELDNFQKASRQLHKITSELQDIVMSIRMVPLSNTFHKMQRIVRDMCKKLDKEVQLELVGEETEVDKNIIEHISDPLMHLVRNAIDHGIESANEREASGKSRIGKVILEAKNVGSDVLITIRDDGKGLSKERILEKARENNLLFKTESDFTDKEIYNLIFLPGFSTKEKVTEFSGRGVGMDVVTKNIEAVGGMVSVDSQSGSGSSFILKIPLTLAIIDGMNIQVGSSHFTIPTTAIKESFRPKKEDIIKDPDGNEMIMMRGQCYTILRLHEFFNVKTEINDFLDGIFIMVEQNDKKLCIFADRLLGQQQVVVKTLPQYIMNIRKKQGLSGCTLLGDGNISLILDISGLSHRSY